MDAAFLYTYVYNIYISFSKVTKYEGSFLFEDHFCLVMELYRCTLISLITFPQQQLAAPQSNGNISQHSSSTASGYISRSGYDAVPMNRQLRRPVASIAGAVRPHNSGDWLLADEATLAAAHYEEQRSWAQQGFSPRPPPIALPLRYSALASVKPEEGPQVNAFDCQSLDALRKIALSIVSALSLLRQEGLIHADIKPENCFVKSEIWNRYAMQSIDTSSVTKGSHFYEMHSSTRSGAPAAIGTAAAHIRGSTAPAVSPAGLSITLLRTLHDLPPDFQILLGDLGNTMHKSEVASYHEDFEVQSLPYRAPEVLIGLPFGPAVDMWSVGVLLLEITTGAPLFVVKSREELLRSMERKLSPLSRVRFSGGKYSDLLTHGIRGASSNSSSGSGRLGSGAGASWSSETDTMKALKRLVLKAIPPASHAIVIQSKFLHFLASLLNTDPDRRLTPQQAISHPFLSSLIPIPVPLARGSVGGSSVRGSTASIRHVRGIARQTTIPVAAATSNTATSVAAATGHIYSNNTSTSSNAVNSCTRGDRGGAIEVRLPTEPLTEPPTEPAAATAAARSMAAVLGMKRSRSESTHQQQW